MKSTKYSQFCYKIFNKLFKEKNIEKKFEKNIKLVKANISMEYDELYSMALMNGIIAFFISLIAALIIYLLIPSSLTLIFVLLIPLLVVVSLAMIYLYLPDSLIKKRANNIDRFLPYAINFISSMAGAGVSPKDIFQTLSKVKVYGEIQKEANRITKEISVMGIDNITALKHAIELSPSKKFKSFLQGIIGTIQSGSDLHNYLITISEKYLEDDIIERKKNLEMLAVVAETFVIAVIAFPIFLVIILTTMGFFGGSMDLSILILVVFSLLILPLVYIGFYFMINSAIAKKISRFVTDKGFDSRSFFKEQKIAILIFIISFVLMGCFIVLTLLLGRAGFLHSGIYLIYDVMFLSILFIIGPLGFYYHIKAKAERDLQEKLPEFLTEIGDSLSSGMNAFDAIKSADKGHFGNSTPEIKRMKAQLSWNISLKEIFMDFSERMKSGVIQRIVVTINEGILMGGNTSKIFKAASKEVTQVNQIEDHRKANMSVYMSVIVLCFFVFLAIIIILDRTIFESFIDLQKQQIGKVGNTINLSVVDPMQLKYSIFTFIYVQSVGSGVLAGYLMDGKISSGVRYGCVLAIISFIIFKLILLQ